MRFSLAALTAGLAATASGQKVKVMLLGDSLTEISCWRPMVWNQLIQAGVADKVDFVGSQNGIGGSCPRPSGFDTNHEGHSGWQAYDIARQYISGWMQTYRPDIVQFMLGTNDVNIGKRNAQSIIDSYTSLLRTMRSVNPRVKVIIDKIIPTSWSDATIEQVNNLIPGWVQSNTTPESPIVIADCSRANGYTNNMLAGDGVHTNQQGDEFIARQIGPKLIQFVNDVLGGSTPSPTSTSAPPAVTTPTNPPPATLTTVVVPPPQPTANCASRWGQCGGNGWQGPTCCSQGTCRRQNDWYSQCI
ncbi:hypothetical protein VTJ83DRAFT_5303 [Remersonia thermophila]|uniref:CBM1 domain-containing protein n=1 Tax=Remersonia thermophila TaxID=72144 RepID=A0ABR4D6J3_9PEZI